MSLEKTDEEATRECPPHKHEHRSRNAVMPHGFLFALAARIVVIHLSPFFRNHFPKR